MASLVAPGRRCRPTTCGGSTRPRWRRPAPTSQILTCVGLMTCGTFATWLEDAAIPSRVIDELMGHTSGRPDHAAGGSPMGRIYRETTPAMVARVTAALDERLG